MHSAISTLNVRFGSKADIRTTLEVAEDAFAFRTA